MSHLHDDAVINFFDLSEWKNRNTSKRTQEVLVSLTSELDDDSDLLAE